MEDQEIRNVRLVQLLDKEKKCRQNNETTGLSALLIEIITFFVEKNDLDNVIVQLLSLSKKRNQSKNAITDMIKYCLDKIYFTLNENDKIRLLNCVIEVTEGKIFVEVSLNDIETICNCHSQIN